MTQHASHAVKRRLSIAARRLGIRDPISILGPDLLDRSFALPLGDPRYGNNSLTPGSMPLEHSFSELSPRALRFDMELAGPLATPQSRREETSRAVRELTHRNFGQAALRWFDMRSEPWRSSSIDGGARFGAFFGAAFDEQGLKEAKAYYELTAEEISRLPNNLEHAVRTAMSDLPGLTPIFTSVAPGRRRGSQRVYLFYPKELRLLDLEPLMHRLGVGQQLSSVLSALGVITGGRFTLPSGSVVIGLRNTPKGIELKLDLLLPAFPDPPRQMHGLIKMHLAQRPDSERAMRDWMQALTPDDAKGPGDLSVIGVRVNPKLPARLNIYLRPTEARPRPAQPHTRRVGHSDPYAHMLPGGAR